MYKAIFLVLFFYCLSPSIMAEDIGQECCLTTDLEGKPMTHRQILNSVESSLVNQKIGSINWGLIHEFIENFGRPVDKKIDIQINFEKLEEFTQVKNELFSLVSSLVMYPDTIVFNKDNKLYQFRIDNIHGQVGDIYYHAFVNDLLKALYVLEENATNYVNEFWAVDLDFLF